MKRQFSRTGITLIYFFSYRIKNPYIFRFSIVNFGKPDSQYGSGMKPVLYSEKEAGLTGVGWHQQIIWQTLEQEV